MLSQIALTEGLLDVGKNSIMVNDVYINMNERSTRNIKFYYTTCVFELTPNAAQHSLRHGK